jgi:hypothetical protein
MHPIYGVIIDRVAIPLPAISEPAVMFLSVAFPLPVILSPCANAGAIIDISVAVRVNAADAVAAAATKNVARILPFMIRIPNNDTYQFLWNIEPFK